MALELVKYQTIMVMLFTPTLQHIASSMISLFRQAAVLCWDTIKEDIHVWAIMQRHDTSTPHSQSSNSTFCDPHQIRQPKRLHCMPHTAEGKEICKRDNAGHCKRGDQCIFTHVHWHPGCQGEHPGKECASLSSSELSPPYNTRNLRGS